jgi:uncharacterized membrane protein YoaK (UPF0700 family)
LTRYGRRAIGLAIALSFLAGYVDALGFLSTGHFFVSFMSGNSTRMGIGLQEGRGQYALIAVGVIGLFVAGVILGSLVAGRWPRHRKAVVLCFVATLLAVAALAQWQDWTYVPTAAMILAMGAENTVFEREGEVAIGLTYMTGSLVKLGQGIAGWLRGGPRWSWVPYALLWSGLVLGAVSGAAMSQRWAAVGLWLGAGYALALALVARYILPAPAIRSGV